MRFENLTTILRRFVMGSRGEGFRLGLCGFALLCSFLAFWLLWPELMVAITAREKRQLQATSLAAEMVMRSDLWAEAALLQAANLFEPAALDQESLIRIEETTEKALHLSPHDARLWLVLAGAKWRRGGTRAIAPLKMSYYTGANETALMPKRLLVVAAVGSADDELRDMMRAELRTMARRRPELRPAIEAAWRAGTPQARAFMASALADIDQAFARRLLGEAR